MLCALLYLTQRSLIYYPISSNALTDQEVIWIENKHEKLKVIVLNKGNDNAFIYFGGNAEDVSLNIPDFQAALSDTAIYLVNYRGYGGSTGTPSEKALFQDAIAIYDSISDKHASISVVGRSLGSGVAMHLASSRDIAKLVLVTPYDSLENIARKYYPIFPISLILQDKYDSLQRASAITSPVLMVIAEHDEIIPRRYSESLMSAFSPQITVEMSVISDASHNSLSMYRQYYDELSGFL